MYIQQVAGRPGTMRRLNAGERLREAYWMIRPLPFPGMRLTLKRLLNYYIVRYQHARGHTKLWGYPLILTVESTNVCNLKCPACLTGAGEVGRRRSMMPMPLFRRIMDELGGYILHLQFFNWGEPLLSNNIGEMIRIAGGKGISTVVSTNFSIPFDRQRAEALVSSGLSILACSIDGATQEGYERYRVGGKLDLILRNVRLVNEAKRTLGCATPQVTWSYRVFEHNRHEVEQARQLAKEHDMEFAASKGWVVEEEWDDGGEFPFPVGTTPERCRYLWTQSVINNDGGVSACCTAFYEEDDYGSVEGQTFKEVWNNKAHQAARRMYHRRDAAEGDENLICYQCPTTLIWCGYQEHRGKGLPGWSFESGYSTNDWFNYFFRRRPKRGKRLPGPGASADSPLPPHP